MLHRLQRCLLGVPVSALLVACAAPRVGDVTDADVREARAVIRTRTASRIEYFQRRTADELNVATTDYRLFQFRKIGGQWKLKAEMIVTY